MAGQNPQIGPLGADSGPAGIPAIIVTYFPDASFVDNLRAIAAQFSEVLIVDNSPAGIDLTEHAQDNVSLFKMETNVGVAAALNFGIREAKEKGYGFAVLFDQDSCPYPDFMAAISQAVSLNSNFATIGCFHGSKATLDCAQTPEKYYPVKTVITSGSLVSIPIWEKLGGFRDDLFIDHVDHEFCLRARKHGYKVLFAPCAKLRHAIGAPKQHRLLGRKILASNHAPFRYYFLFRNVILISRDLFFSEPKWFIDMGLIILPKMLIKSVLFEKSGRDKLRFALRGIRDGVKNISGPCPCG